FAPERFLRVRSRFRPRASSSEGEDPLPMLPMRSRKTIVLVSSFPRRPESGAQKPLQPLDPLIESTRYAEHLQTLRSGAHGLRTRPNQKGDSPQKLLSL